MEFYKNTATGIKKLFSIALSTNLDLTNKSNIQYKLSLGCTCAALKRFTCFSQTLNCIIIQRAGGNCIGALEEDVTTW